MMNVSYGYQRIVEPKMIIVKPEKVQVKRTWIERLFRDPFVTHREELREVIPDNVCRFLDGHVLVNSKTYYRLMTARFDKG